MIKFWKQYFSWMARYVGNCIYRLFKPISLALYSHSN